MHTLKITLKQHTPLIHFQHDQEGATLRASEVKPKLDRYIIQRVFNNNYDECKEYLVGFDKQKPDNLRERFNSGYRALDYKMRIDDDNDNLISLYTNFEREYTDNNEKKDKRDGKTIRIVHSGDKIEQSDRNVRYVIEEDGTKYFAKKRKSDSKIIFDLDSYPCFFANMDSDITDFDEYRKVTFARNSFSLIIQTKHEKLYKTINNSRLLSSFFLNHNFGTRQSKGFGSFYIDRGDPLFLIPSSMYRFALPITEEYGDYEDDNDYYDKVFFNLFSSIELFYRTLRPGINEKRGQNTVFYFKSLAFKYCKEVLSAEWDKKRVKKEFYFANDQRRKDSLQAQRNRYNDDDDHDILFFDAEDGYDMRDLMGFSTNEEWQSYKDSIEKKVAIIENGRTRFPRRDEVLPVDRMRSPLLIKPICSVDDEGNVSYIVYLLFQDEIVGMSGLKRQQKMCFYSKKERDKQQRLKRFMLDIPRDFSLSDYFDYIFNKDRLNFDISNHVEEKYQDHDYYEIDYYEILDDIYTQIKENLQ